MQHGAKRPFCHFVFKDAATVKVRCAGVNDNRQAGCTGGRDMRAKAALLGLARAMLLEIVQSCFAKCHDFRVTRQFDQLARGDTILFVGLMRVCTDGAIDLGKSLRDRQQSAQAPHPCRDGEDASDIRGCGTRDDAIEVVREIGKVEMAVAIDKHLFKPLTLELVRHTAGIPAPALEARCSA